jgi:hypothetical protein
LQFDDDRLEPLEAPTVAFQLVPKQDTLSVVTVSLRVWIPEKSYWKGSGRPYL